MPKYLYTAPNGQTVEMTFDRPPSEEQKAAVYRDAGVDIPAKNVEPPSQTNENGPDWKALVMQGASKSFPMAADIAAAAANAPNLPKTASAIGNAVGFIAPVVKGAYDLATGNPSGVHSLIEAGPAAWASGKGAFYTALGAQRIAKPLAAAAQSVAPYAQALSTASGAQGVGDLAQMAEPNRTDIGTMGMGSSDSKAAQQASVMRSQIQNLVNSGLSLNDAIRRVSEAWRPR